MFELKFVSVVLNHQLLIVNVDEYHVDELFHRESKILGIDNKLYVFDNDYYHHLNFHIQSVNLLFYPEIKMKVKNHLLPFLWIKN